MLLHLDHQSLRLYVLLPSLRLPHQRLILLALTLLLLGFELHPSCCRPLSMTRGRGDTGDSRAHQIFPPPPTDSIAPLSVPKQTRPSPATIENPWWRGGRAYYCIKNVSPPPATGLAPGLSGGIVYHPCLKSKHMYVSTTRSPQDLAGDVIYDWRCHSPPSHTSGTSRTR